MMDFASGLSHLMYRAVAAERAHEASRREWLRRFREMQRKERAAEAKARTVVVRRPRHLAGVHKL